jgi:hypothetical protein
MPVVMNFRIWPLFVLLDSTNAAELAQLYKHTLNSLVDFRFVTQNGSTDRGKSIIFLGVSSRSGTAESLFWRFEQHQKGPDHEL